MSNEHTQAAALAADLFNKLTDLLDTESAAWMSIDVEKEPERAALAKQLWSKALMCALAQQLGIIEAALMLGEELPESQVREVREQWIAAGHRFCLDAVTAQNAKEKGN